MNKTIQLCIVIAYPRQTNYGTTGVERELRPREGDRVTCRQTTGQGNDHGGRASERASSI